MSFLNKNKNKVGCSEFLDNNVNINNKQTWRRKLFTGDDSCCASYGCRCSKCWDAVNNIGNPFGAAAKRLGFNLVNQNVNQNVKVNIPKPPSVSK